MQSLLENINPILDVNNSNWDVGLTNFLKYFLEEIHRQTNHVTMINFAQAAIVLQKSVCIYESKVDFIWQLMEQLLDVLKVSKSVAEAENQEQAVDEESRENEPTPSKPARGRRKKRSSEPYVVEEFCQIHDKVSGKSLDLPKNNGNTAEVRNSIIKSAVFGRMVNLKKKREYELYYFDNNGECMGLKDDFRSSWPINEQCALIEDRLDDSMLMPPPATEDVGSASSPRRELHLLSPLNNDEASRPEHPNCVANCVADIAENPTGPASPAGDLDAPLSPAGDSNGPPSPTMDICVPPTPATEDPNVACDDQALAMAGGLLANTPPDSGRQRSQTSGEEVPVTDGAESGRQLQEARRSLSERQELHEGDKFGTLNYLFSKSVLEDLGDSMSSVSSVVEQSRRNSKKGRNMLRVIQENGEILGFEELTEENQPSERTETALPSGDDAPTHVPASPERGVPTPPSTPPGSHAMSPGPVTGTQCIGEHSPSASIYEPDTLHLEPFRPNEKELNDRAARVAAWHKSIKQRLEEADSRPPFNVHTYSSKIIDTFPSLNSELRFEELVTGMDSSEVSRVFLTSLMLANTKNVELSLLDPSPLPVDCLSLKLISAQRHEIELEAFCAPDVNRGVGGAAPSSSSSGESMRKRKQPNNDTRCKPRKQSRR